MRTQVYINFEINIFFFISDVSESFLQNNHKQIIQNYNNKGSHKWGLTIFLEIGYSFLLNHKYKHNIIGYTKSCRNRIMPILRKAEETKRW